MPVKLDQPPSPPSALAEATRLSARRRFARAGLAAPIVLGTLASKPVLGQTGPPYNCTISGQVSGNVSNASNVDCATLGFTPEHWRDTAAWPPGFTRGALPNGQCNFGGGPNAAGTLFSPTFAMAFGHGSSGAPPVCSVVYYPYPNVAPASATMYEVLRTTGLSEDLVFGRQVVASLLNAYAKAPTYPLTPAGVVDMFNEVWQTGLFKVSLTMSWTRTQAITFLQGMNGTN
jgi:hypothetical protein